MASSRDQTQTGGRDASTGFISGDYSLAVGMPETPTPDGWKWTKLTDVARLESGHTPSRRHSEYWDDGDVCWIGIRDATANHGQTLEDTNQHATQLGIDNSSARILPKDTVCLSRTASVGYVVVMGKPMATSQDFVNWVCSDKLNHQFLKYILLSENRSFLRFASGTTHQTIYFPEVKAFHISLPPLPEQKAIAHILGSLDDKIELNRKMNATLEAMAQALFKSWFVDFDPVIDNVLRKNLAKHPSPSLSQGERDLAGPSPSGRSGDEGALQNTIFNGIPEELLARAEIRRQAIASGTANEAAAKDFPSAFQETEAMGWIPEGWEVKPIEKCIQRFPAGKKYASKTAKESGAVPILDQGKSGLIGFHNDEPGVRASPHDPIIVFANHTCYMRLIMFDFSAIQNVLPFKGDGLNIFWLFEATKGRQQFNEYKGHWPDFVIKKLVVPTLPLVSIFGEIAEANHRKIYANELENQALSKLRDTLLPKLIAGEVRIPTAETLTCDLPI